MSCGGDWYTVLWERGGRGDSCQRNSTCNYVLPKLALMRLAHFTY